jgi:hypothetical protein
LHDFDAQRTRGETGEAILDRFFEARGHLIQPATRGQQLRGIDRVFVKDGKIAYVEYKTDYRAHETGHVFVETISVDTDDTAGWAYTSGADFLVYYIPALNRILVMPLENLRKLLPGWVEAHPTRPAQNKAYATHGVLVPLSEFEGHATQVFTIDQGWGLRV